MVSHNSKPRKTTVATRSWVAASKEVQLAAFRKALTDQKGNVTRAATAIGVHRSHAMRLLKEFGLVKFAAELRVKSGAIKGKDGRVSGRPKK